MAGNCKIEWEEDWNYIDDDGNPLRRVKSSAWWTKLLRTAKIIPSRPTTAQNDQNSDGDQSQGPGGSDDGSPRDMETGRADVLILDDGKSVKSSNDDDIVAVEGGGYLRRMREEAIAAAENAKLAALEEKRRKEASVTDWMEWKCVVCGKKNRRPRHPPSEFNLAFSEKGVYFKRTVAHLIKERDMPRCEWCTTYADYKPRLCTAHTFPYNPNPHEAFDNYPEMIPQVPRSLMSTCFDKSISCLFGQRNHPDSRLMANDWRMSIYLSSRFPVVPRPVKLPHELFELGEVVECRRQKMDWSRARIIESRQTHIYDIK